MHALTQSCVLFLWLHALTLVKSQDCTLADFLAGPLYDSNFDTSELEPTYSGGRQVRVGCIVGFTGFFKLLCIEGKWQSRGNKCQPRSCGHPGDAQFADFHLARGNDFVFGSEVVYTCHKGYQMVSRKHSRNCMAEGWDGVVPVCEAQHCPVIHVDDNLLVTGDPEEATFGNVLRFSCKSNSHILDGPSELYCDENGRWNGDAPKCTAIECKVPVIENGSPIGDKRVYEQHEILYFECNNKYKRTEDRPSTCKKTGSKAEFIPAPECEQIKCTLMLPPVRGTSYEPSSRNVFFPTDTVRITCGESYWFNKQRFHVATCQDNGKWDFTMTSPVCQEVVCHAPQNNYLEYWDRYRTVNRRTKKLGDKVNYRCTTGYKNTDDINEATCTRDGWIPNPLCEALRCNRRDVENAEIVINKKDTYVYNEQVRYHCKEGYEGKFTLTCRENVWIGNPVCTERPCARLEIENANIQRNAKWEYGHNEEVQYVCRGGSNRLFTITCGPTGWTGIQSCTECGKPKIQNGFAVGPYDKTLYYSCSEGFKFFTGGWWKEAKCTYGQWSEFVKCIDEKKCGEIPAIPNAEVKPSSDDTDSMQDQPILIQCKEGYRAKVSHMSCQEGKWHFNGMALEMVCTPIANPCKPPQKVKNAIILSPYQEEYLSGSEVTYQCRDQYTMEGDYKIKCDNGTWETSNLACTRYCDRPKDERQTMTFTVDKERYEIGDVIEYQCNFPAVKPGGSATCIDGTWNQRIHCEEGCERPPSLPNGETTTRVKLEYNHGDRVEYACRHGYVLQNESHVTCRNGEWVGNITCLEPLGCGKPPRLPNGEITTSINLKYNHDDRINYACRHGYILQNESHMTCHNGEWVGNIKCLNHNPEE